MTLFSLTLPCSYAVYYCTIIFKNADFRLTAVHMYEFNDPFMKSKLRKKTTMNLNSCFDIFIHSNHDIFIIYLQYDFVMLLNLSCPAVSHNCNLIGVPSATLSTRAKKSTPTVGSETSKNEPSVKHLSRELLPTPESPIRMTLNWYSKKGSIRQVLLVSHKNK